MLTTQLCPLVDRHVPGGRRQCLLAPVIPSRPLVCLAKPCKSTFRDNQGRLFAGRMALVINDNTFVFDAISGIWRKMVAVNRAGTEIAWWYFLKQTHYQMAEGSTMS